MENLIKSFKKAVHGDSCTGIFPGVLLKVAVFAQVLGITLSVAVATSSCQVIPSNSVVASIAHTLGIVLFVDMRTLSYLSLGSVPRYLFLGPTFNCFCLLNLFIWFAYLFDCGLYKLFLF